MQNIISQLANQELSEQDLQNLQKQLLRHQKPIVFQVTALMELIAYEKSIIPQHLHAALISSIKEYILREIEKL